MAQSEQKRNYMRVYMRTYRKRKQKGRQWETFKRGGNHERHRVILFLKRQGFSAKQIGLAFGITTQYTENLLNRIRKCGCIEPLLDVEGVG